MGLEGVHQGRFRGWFTATAKGATLVGDGSLKTLMVTSTVETAVDLFVAPAPQPGLTFTPHFAGTLKPGESRSLSIPNEVATVTWHRVSAELSLAQVRAHAWTPGETLGGRTVGDDPELVIE